MNEPEFVSLFHQMKPDFFERPYIRKMPPEQINDEMVLFLSEYDRNALAIPYPENVTFGIYKGEREKLLQAVESIVPGWVEHYRNADDEEIYCATVGDEISSFCLLEDFGKAEFLGKTVSISGPGCVGTVRKFRRNGIGLKMIQNATAIFQDRGYDISYIHWTGVARWYAKLGYKTVVQWTGQGVTK